MDGVIVQVSISAGGLPKTAIDGGMLTEMGVEGDRHTHQEFHGGPKKAILLVSAEVLEEMKARGYALFPGALGENLTTRGIDVRKLRTGSRLRAGQALLEISSPRTPCSALDIFGAGLKRELCDAGVQPLGPDSPYWGMGGLYACVVEPGAVRPGDIIAVVS
jgi:MOSC domain-containing protein YiiM